MTHSIEVSAVREDAGHIETCNDATEQATAVAVYVRTPFALHVRDFDVSQSGPLSARPYSFARAAVDAFAFAEGLGDALALPIVGRFGRYAVEPQRDANRGKPAELGTDWTRCDAGEAEQWAVYAYAPDAWPGDAELVEDYPSQALAAAAVLALYRGERAPPPPARVPVDPVEAVRLALPFVEFHEGSDPPGEMDVDSTLASMRAVIAAADRPAAPPPLGKDAPAVLEALGYTREAIDHGGAVWVRRIDHPGKPGQVGAVILASDARDTGGAPALGRKGWKLTAYRGNPVDGMTPIRWSDAPAGSSVQELHDAAATAARLARCLVFGGAR